MKIDGYQESMSEAKRVLLSLPTPTATMSLLNEERRDEQAIVACVCLLQAIYVEVSFTLSRSIMNRAVY